MPRKPKPVDKGPEFLSLLGKIVRVPKAELAELDRLRMAGDRLSELLSDAVGMMAMPDEKFEAGGKE